MFKQRTVLEVEGAGGRVHRYDCDPQSPLGEVHDVLEKMKSLVVEQIKAKSKPVDEEKVEEVDVEQS